MIMIIKKIIIKKRGTYYGGETPTIKDYTNYLDRKSFKIIPNTFENKYLTLNYKDYEENQYSKNI